MVFNYLFFKRICDLILAIFLLIIFSPIFVLVSVLIFIFDGLPIIFKQKRVGKNEEIFMVYKFRTMKTIKNKISDTISINTDQQRTTNIGLILRKLSLDELPQLINIISGKMSFIGPRPLLIDYLPLYDFYQKKRHRVKPGISGLAQVRGRNSISWNKRFEYDVYYVNNLNLLLDFRIIIQTFFKVFLMRDINESNTKSMTPFRGNNE